jgi:hypothetical protein
MEMIAYGDDRFVDSRRADPLTLKAHGTVMDGAHHAERLSRMEVIVNGGNGRYPPLKRVSATFSLSYLHGSRSGLRTP